MQLHPSLICSFVSIVEMNRNKDRRTGVINRRMNILITNDEHKISKKASTGMIEIRSA